MITEIECDRWLRHSHCCDKELNIRKHGRGYILSSDDKSVEIYVDYGKNVNEHVLTGQKMVLNEADMALIDTINFGAFYPVHEAFFHSKTDEEYKLRWEAMCKMFAGGREHIKIIFNSVVDAVKCGCNYPRTKMELVTEDVLKCLEAARIKHIIFRPDSSFNLGELFLCFELLRRGGWNYVDCIKHGVLFRRLGYGNTFAKQSTDSQYKPEDKVRVTFNDNMCDWARWGGRELWDTNSKSVVLWKSDIGRMMNLAESLPFWEEGIITHGEL